MSKLGAYSIKTVSNNKLFKDAELINSVLKKQRKPFGTYSRNTNLFNENKLLAKSGTVNLGVNDYNNFCFNETSLYNKYPETVSAADYTSILQNRMNPGLKSYNPNLRYVLDDKNLSDNIEEKTTPGGELGATYTLKDCPVLFIRYFNASVDLNTVITIEYFVDTKSVDSVNKGIYNNTFTLYIYDSSDTVIASKTTYAGWHKLDLPISLTSQYGENYFTAKCVDNRKVGSHIQCFDILVKDTSYQNFYQMTADDLQFTYNNQSYTITVDEDTELLAYKNKLALTAFFKHVKEDLLDDNNQHYNGVVMYNSGNTSYWLSYMHNILLGKNDEQDIDAEIDLGEPIFYEVVVASGQPKNTVSEVNQITESTALNKFKSTSDSFAALSSGDAPYEVGDETSLSVGNHYYVFNAALKYREATKNTTLRKGKGDNLLFPDNFTVDLNGASIKATKGYALNSSELIMFRYNVNTHLINGKVVGDYENYDMSHGAMLQMPSNRNGVPSQWMGSTSFSGSRFCSMSDLEISYTTGYGGNTSGGKRYYVGEAHGNSLKFDEVGAINENGLDVNCSYMYRTALASKRNLKAKAEYGVEVNVGTNGGTTTRADNFEIFLSFYDENMVHLKTVKVRLYSRIKLPDNAKYVRGCAYTFEGSAPTGVNIRSNIYSDNVTFKNSYWHHTRTTAITLTYADNVLFSNNKYYKIAIENVKPVTKILGDTEDSHWYFSKVAMKNCTNLGGGQGGWSMGETHWLEFTGNSGISLSLLGEGLFAGLIANSYIPEFRINNVATNYRFPALLMNNNIIAYCNLHRDLTNEDFSKSNPVVTMSNSIIRDKQCGYKFLNLIRCKNKDMLD